MVMSNEAGKVRRFWVTCTHATQPEHGMATLAVANTDYEASERRVDALKATNEKLRELVMAVHKCGDDVWVEPIRGQYWIQARNEAMADEVAQ
jgi:hypothetical protein